MSKTDAPVDWSSLPIHLTRPEFCTALVGEAASALQDVVGLEEASGIISVVGQRVGSEIKEQYVRAVGRDRFTAEEVAAVLVDLKRRIGGDFFVIEQSEDRLVLGNRRCPFGDHVKGRPALCMMTSNVFGLIASDSLGYAKVVLEETIAAGAAGCRVVVHLRASPEVEAETGREYFRD